MLTSETYFIFVFAFWNSKHKSCTLSAHLHSLHGVHGVFCIQNVKKTCLGGHHKISYLKSLFPSKSDNFWVNLKTENWLSAFFCGIPAEQKIVTLMWEPNSKIKFQLCQIIPHPPPNPLLLTHLSLKQMTLRKGCRSVSKETCWQFPKSTAGNTRKIIQRINVNKQD